MSVAAFKVLWSRPFRRWSVAVALARLPSSMAAVALTSAAALFLGDTARGGSLTTIFVVCLLLFAPINAAWADKVGARLVLFVQMISSAASWAALTVLVAVHAAPWSWYLPVVGAGVSLAGVSAELRSTLGFVVGSPQLRVASSLDAVLMDVVIVGAPLVVSAAVAVTALGAVAVAVPASLAAAASVRLLPRRGFPAASPAPQRPLRSRPGQAATPNPEPPRAGPAILPGRRAPVLAWTCAGAAFGLMVGSLEIGAVSLVQAHGRPVQQAWLVFATLAGSSVIGGLADAATARWDHGGHRTRLAILSLIMSPAEAPSPYPGHGRRP